MKRIKCNKIRTTTEIINSDDKVHKSYDLTEFDIKNKSSLDSYETLKIKLVLVKYMAMLNTLELTQPILEIFRNKSDTQQISAVVSSSLGFVHNRFNAMVTHFNNNMEFVITETKDTCIPGEPILFTENDNKIMCAVDRKSIVKMLSRDFDLDSSIEYGNLETDGVRIAKVFGAAENPKKLQKSYSPSHVDDGLFSSSRSRYDESKTITDFNLTENEVTQYLILLLIVEHAYLHYHIFKNYGLYEYGESLRDHSTFTNKLRSSMNEKISNLLLSKFKFTIEDFDKINSSSVVSGFNILNFNK
jgi:Baculovirus occlusion-derived virus envelope protein EC27